MCVAPDAVFCDACVATLVPVASACDRCGLPERGPRCSACVKRAPAYAAARAPLLYGGALAEAIQRLKFEDAVALARPLATLLAPLVDELRERVDLVVPVPLHVRRLRARGYNQAALLARQAAAGARPVDFRALQRPTDTPPQWRLTRAQRLENLRGAFRAQPRRVRGRRVLLLDDVMTTGATAASCAQALHAAGAAEILVLTLARAVP